MINKLIKLANKLDKNSLHKMADVVDLILKDAIDELDDTRGEAIFEEVDEEYMYPEGSPEDEAEGVQEITELIELLDELKGKIVRDEELTDIEKESYTVLREGVDRLMQAYFGGSLHYPVGETEPKPREGKAWGAGDIIGESPREDIFDYLPVAEAKKK